MKYDKFFLRNKFLLQRKKKYLTPEKFNFALIFKLIKKHFNTKKVTIAGYYPSYYEVDILKFLEKASKCSTAIGNLQILGIHRFTKFYQILPYFTIFLLFTNKAPIPLGP